MATKHRWRPRAPPAPMHRIGGLTQPKTPRQLATAFTAWKRSPDSIP